MKLTFKETRDTYWKYYISLEKQFLETERFVEFDYVTNGKSYSMEYMKLFQAVCSEIDVIGKVLAQCVNPSFTPSRTTGINEWWFHIQTAFPDLIHRKYALLDDRDIQPWKNFIVTQNPNKNAKKFIINVFSNPKGKTPVWWNDYNSAKHNRTGKMGKHQSNYAKANLKNLFYAFSALYSLEVLLMEHTYNEDDEPIVINLESRLFTKELPFYTYLLSV